MDGNGRWAKEQNLSRLKGHRRGADIARDIVEWASDAKIRQISLYAFSTENWDRPDDEVRGLMSLLATMLPLHLPKMLEQGVRLKVLGEISALPWIARKALNKTMDATCHNTHIDLILCLNYGGQQEIIEGAKRLATAFRDGTINDHDFNQLNPNGFRKFLWRDDLLPVDLLIRTGGEYRISNFHLWDAAYAELFFSDCYWPDYTEKEFHQALHAYAQRERRFGQTSDQLHSLPHPDSDTPINE